MSSSSTAFNMNDVVFVENIGYGVLIDCGNLKTLASKEELPILGEKKLSIYFDPDMFNSESDSFYRKKSEAATIVPDPKPVLSVTTPPAEHVEEVPTNNLKTEKKINLVKVKLDGCGFIITTPDYNIRKYVIVPVRPMFLSLAGSVNIRIEIGKTIESFKREIFALLGLQHSHYYNVKFFTTTPCLTELNSPAKTIWQCSIKESSILVMTAEHGFCFENIPAEFTNHFATANNGLTFTHLPKHKTSLNAESVIALPQSIVKVETVLEEVQNNTVLPIVPLVQIDDSSFQSPVRPQKKDQDGQAEVVLIQEPNIGLVPVPHIPEEAPLIEKVEIPAVELPPKEEATKEEKLVEKIERSASEIEDGSVGQFLEIKGDKSVKSGKHYFEVKLDKLPTNPEHLQISLSSEKGHKKWTYFPLTRQKVSSEGEEVKEKKDYGACVKQGDSIGVFVKIEKNKSMKVSFYKNSVGLGLCWEAQIFEIHFMFGLGSGGEISLDTRIQQPLDCYRF